MQLSWNVAHPGGPGHVLCDLLNGLGYRLSVFVDGVAQRRVVYVDTVHGICLRFDETPEGEVAMRCGEPVVRRLEGVVRLEIDRV